MSAAERHPLPESTGLPGSGLTPARQRQVAWLRQARGVYRAAARARLVPAVLAGRLYWLLIAQALLAAVAAWGIGQSGLDRVPPEAAWAATGTAILLLLIQSLGRLGSLTNDLLRDVDQQVLDAFDASPLSSSAYVAGRLGFHLVEQALGLAALLPLFGLAFALRGLEAGDLVAVVVALFVVSTTHGLFVVGRVLRGHARRPRGAAMPPSLRPSTGAIVAQSLLGLTFAAVTFTAVTRGTEELSPLLLALALTPAVPILSAVDGWSLEVFGRPLALWAAAAAGLVLLTPFAWASARLRWKPPVRAAGVDLRAGFALAWALPALALSGTLRADAAAAAVAMLLVAGAGALLPPAWAGGGELAALGDRPGARPRGLLGQRRSTAGAWALALQLAVLLLLALLAPAGAAPRGDWLLLALACFAGTAPVLLVAAATARHLGPQRATVVATVLAGLAVAGVLAGLPRLLALFEGLPLVGPAARAVAGPAQLLASASPLVVLPEAAARVLPAARLDSWYDLAAPWNLGLSDWGCGVLVQAVVGLPAAWWLSRLARRRGR